MDFIKIFIVVQIGRLAVLILFQRRFYKRQKNANCEVIDYSPALEQDSCNSPQQKTFTPPSPSHPPVISGPLKSPSPPFNRLI